MLVIGNVYGYEHMCFCDWCAVDVPWKSIASLIIDSVMSDFLLFGIGCRQHNWFRRLSQTIRGYRHEISGANSSFRISSLRFGERLLWRTNALTLFCLLNSEPCASSEHLSFRDQNCETNINIAWIVKEVTDITSRRQKENIKTYVFVAVWRAMNEKQWKPYKII